jgi:hypothetical protein
MRFDIPAIAALEATLGAPYGEIVLRLQRLSITTICAAIWAACKHEDPTLTIALTHKKLQRYLDDGGSMRALCDALNAAVVDSAPLKEVELPNGPAETGAAG